MSYKFIAALSAAFVLSLTVGRAQIFSNGAVIGDSNIEAAGPVVYAFNMSDDGGSTTINSVTFTDIDPANVTSSDFSLSNLPNGLDGTGGGNLPDGTDGNYSSALQNLVEQGLGNNWTLVLKGLAQGQTYSFEAIFDANQKDARTQALQDTTNGPGDSPTSATITSGGDQGYPDQNPNPVPTGAQYITDTFTATGSTETLVAQIGGGNGAQMSGFVLESVPEPGTWAMMGLGAAGLVFLARRKSLRA